VVEFRWLGAVASTELKLDIWRTAMSSENTYRTFVGKYLTRGAVGVSVGLAAVASTPCDAATQQNTDDQVAAQSFAGRLSTVRTAVADYMKEASTHSAQSPRPGEEPPVKAFNSFEE
jgi:hypothetical protein